MGKVDFQSVGKVYGDGTRAVDDLNLDVADGEFMVLVGPSGCGKTTALRMVAGLEEITEGTIAIDDSVVNDLDTRKRDVAMVFQNYALYPQMSVYDNIAFGLKMHKTPKAEIRRRVLAVATTLGLEALLERKPRSLSGGQRQRVAMGRAIVREPQVFLMDEPLSNLDAKLRVQMRAEITRIQRRVGATTIYVTHDQIEAMTMGDRVAVMRRGKLQQVAEPQVLYDNPRNLFVASFIGNPTMNLIQAKVERREQGGICRVGDQELLLPAETFKQHPTLDAYRNKVVGVGLRPEHITSVVEASSANLEERLVGEVVDSELLGSERLMYVEVDAEPILTAEVLEVAHDVDVTVAEGLASMPGRHRSVFIATVDRAMSFERGTTVALSVKPEKLYFFDLATEEAIERAGDDADDADARGKAEAALAHAHALRPPQTHVGEGHGGG